MDIPLSREQLRSQVVQLRKEGRSRRSIARALKVSRNTVRKILEDHDASREAPQTALPEPRIRAPREKKLDTYMSQIDELLDTFPDITAQRIFEELRESGYEGGYTAVKDILRPLRPKPKPDPSTPLPDYGPGQMAESDWSPYTITFTDGKQMLVQAFAYVLCHSRRKSFFFYPSGDFHALMDGHVRTFERFGGAASRCKYDSQKAVVLRWEGPQPIYNPRFVAFATYYEFGAVACTRKRPNQKAHVERAFWELERSFFNGRRFADFDDLCRQLADWQDHTCDVRPHKKLKRSALDMFSEEKDALVPLPNYPYDTARVVYRVCSIDGFISWNGNRYAVPYEHITDILPVRITQTQVIVYAADLKPIACHELAPKSAGQDIGADRLHPRTRGHRSASDADQVRAAFQSLGEEASAFFEDLQKLRPRLAAYHGRQVLLLRQRYATHDICRALQHAHMYGALDHKSVARILSAKAAPRTLAEYVQEEVARRLRDAGATEVSPRDLTEYDALPIASEPSQEDNDA
jgi:transposase